MLSYCWLFKLKMSAGSVRAQHKKWKLDRRVDRQTHQDERRQMKSEKDRQSLIWNEKKSKFLLCSFFIQNQGMYFIGLQTCRTLRLRAYNSRLCPFKFAHETTLRRRRIYKRRQTKHDDLMDGFICSSCDRDRDRNCARKKIGSSLFSNFYLLIPFWILSLSFFLLQE